LGFEPASVEVLYEDDALLFVNKPPGLIVARSRDPIEPTLFDLAAAHAGKIFLMQRLDRGTSGVMFFSKLASINPRLTRHFETKLIRKRYLALAEGDLGERQTIDAPLARIGPISFGVRDHGKRAMTDLIPRRATRNGSLLEVALRTGRTHQIRVHLAAIGHPLVGDPRYGGGSRHGLRRQFLHSSRLGLEHPESGATLEFSSELPEDLREALERARGS
jgi:23S rRNA pseudouridine1911/1915/1917 synthase